jgi:hypothetical protein
VVTATDVDVVFDVILGSGILEGVIVVVIDRIDLIAMVLGWDGVLSSSSLLSVTLRLMDLLLSSSAVFVIDFDAALAIGDEAEAPAGIALPLLLRRRREGDSGRIMVLLSIAVVIDCGGVGETFLRVGIKMMCTRCGE